MKKIISLFIAAAVMLSVFTACSSQQQGEGTEADFIGIQLSDDGVMVGGTPASTDENEAVYVANDIVFYLEGQGSEYGEGEADEQHSQAEADKHTVVHITQPGNYTITGKLSYGQIAIDLGDDAKKDPDAVVNIVLDNAEITSTVAPAIICYSAYECGSDDTETATKDVDTETAGFNITLADGSVNIVNGSHVAKIYKPGTEDKLHKYDAAIESLVSFNIYSESGTLNLTSDNEGIETKMHMTINGGNLNINSADDALNAGEDGVSVITINGGNVLANANNGAEGDGIDSNGWLVVNGGSVSAFGNSGSMDSGIDSDMGIYINGGTVFATGNMYDEIAQDSQQTFTAFNFAQSFADKYIVMKSLDGKAVVALDSAANGSVMVYSSQLLTEGYYTVYSADSVTGEFTNGICTDVKEISGEVQLAHSGTTGSMMGGRPQMGGFGGQMPQNGEMPQMPQSWNEGNNPIPDRGTPPQGMENMPAMDFDKQKPQGDMPQAMPTPDGENFNPGNMANMPMDFGGEGEFEFDFDFSSVPDMNFGGFSGSAADATETVFTIVKGGNIFNSVAKYTAE